jgi:hypothetical protein
MQSRERQEREDIEEQMDLLNREAEEIKRENQQLKVKLSKTVN